MYTLIVGNQEWSSWSLRPYLALTATDATFNIELIRLRQPPTSRENILKRSPSGKVPALQFTENGKTQTIWDSLAICETLAERHPAARLWPRDANVRARARAYACEMHSGFPDLRDQLTMEFGRRLTLPELRPETRAQVDRIIAAWEDALTVYGGKDGFLFGDFCIADCMYAPVVSRFTTYDVKVPQRVKVYMEKIWALAGMQNWAKGAEGEIAEGIS